MLQLHRRVDNIVEMVRKKKYFIGSLREIPVGLNNVDIEPAVIILKK